MAVKAARIPSRRSRFMLGGSFVGYLCY
jgi:hypothetical protein